MYVTSAGLRTWECWVSESARWCPRSWVCLCSGPDRCHLDPQTSLTVLQKGRGRTWTLCSASGCPVFPVEGQLKVYFISFTKKQEKQKKNWKEENLPDKPVGSTDGVIRNQSRTFSRYLLPPSVQVLLMKFTAKQKDDDDILWHRERLTHVDKYLCGFILLNFNKLQWRLCVNYTTEYRLVLHTGPLHFIFSLCFKMP